MSDIEHPNLEKCNYGRVLFLGASGTGKSYGLKELVQNLQQKTRPVPPVYTINVGDADFSTGLKKQVTATFAQMAKIKEGSIVVVEDIINLNTKEEVCLRQLLNYWAHHKSLKVFCVSHNIFKTKLFNTLSYFHFVIFTSSLSNLHLLKKCLSYFQVDPEVVSGWQAKIKSFGGPKGVYYFWDNSQRIFFATNKLTDPGSARELGKADSPDQDASEEKLRADLQRRFDIFFRGRQNAAQASAVFSIIVDCLNPKHIRLTDLTLNFTSRQGPKRVSLVDYVNSLLTADPKNKPEPSHLIVHKYVSTHCTIPEIFLLNSQFS